MAQLRIQLDAYQQAKLDAMARERGLEMETLAADLLRERLLQPSDTPLPFWMTRNNETLEQRLYRLFD